MSEEIKDIQTESRAENQTSSYRSIFKATSLFGGVQVYNIIIGIIRQKFVAVLLGTEGMGMQGLFTSGTQLIQGISSMGLSSSAVRDVSEANGTGDMRRVSRTVTILRRLVWLTGLLGMIATICMSPVLSKSLFGNYDYTLPFIILSVTLLIDQISKGQSVVLQGMRRLRHLAQSSAIGVTVGLFVSIPLYYLLGVKGIVPTILLNSITSLSLSWYFARKVRIEKVKVTNRETFREGRNMLKMGIAMSATGVVGSLMVYILRAYISYKGGVNEVGLYTAGSVILTIYIGMIFTALGTDFYPRLAAVNANNERCSEVINQQGEIALLIIGPIVMGCIIFMPFLIRLIYSEAFMPACNFILWAVPGVMLRAASVVVAYIFLAKAEAKLYIINDVFSALYGLVLRIGGYYLWGLDGVGIAYVLLYVIYAIQVYLIARHRYKFQYSTQFLRAFVIQMMFIAVGFSLVHFGLSAWTYVPLVLLFVGCGIYSLRELDKRMDLLAIVKKRKK